MADELATRLVLKLVCIDNIFAKSNWIVFSEKCSSARYTKSQTNFPKSNNFGLFNKGFIWCVSFQLGFFRRKKREELNQYKRKSYAHARQSRALTRASRDLDAEDRKILSQYTQMN